MRPVSRSIRALAGALLLAAATVFLSTCGGIGGSEFSGGGTGGTGISTAAISGFGSVVMNGAHYRTDNNVAPGFKTKKVLNGKDNSGRADSDVFAVGMIVTVRHGVADNNALEIEYRDNLQGPVAKKIPGTDNVLEILGQSVVVENAAIFASLKQNDVVEVSGYADNAGRIRASRIFSLPPPLPPPAQEFELKGFVSGLSLSGAAFRIGPLPDGSGVTVAVSYDAAAIAGLSGGLDNGIFVQVTTADTAPVAGSITATRVVKLAARTEFPDGTPVDLEGLVTTPWGGSGNDLSFAVEGKPVRWDAGTEFGGGPRNRDDLRQTNLKVQVHGMENGGVLSAARIVFR